MTTIRTPLVSEHSMILIILIMTLSGILDLAGILIIIATGAILIGIHGITILGIRLGVIHQCIMILGFMAVITTGMVTTIGIHHITMGVIATTTILIIRIITKKSIMTVKDVHVHQMAHIVVVA